ncbi:hypothetical protein [Micromonospora cathayae]|uniref:Uncharacterized protein n=1 Tax=Micromonospora cathayae TaxID=3028804 RepID=A0ABY7ZU60_9ACTN|nr:hypothetical protein [Micromonospora sp. HUAS 3]WDZ86413.1 hypothetical protein PVK37_08450 [Micromonospora sp. HUAS 3]
MVTADSPPQPRRRSRSLVLWLPAVGAVWLLAAGLHLFGLRIANLWLLGTLVHLAGWLAAITVTALAVLLTWRAGGPRRAALVLVPGVLAPAVIVAVDWTSLYVHHFYRLHRADFAAAAALDDKITARYDDRYGQLLPDDLQHLSAGGRAVRLDTGADAGPTAPFLPVRIGSPDGASGYAHLTGAAIGTTFDCFAAPCRVRWSLGDGWYWLDGPG